MKPLKHYWVHVRDESGAKMMTMDFSGMSGKQAVLQAQLELLNAQFETEECGGCPDCKGITYDLPEGEID